MKKLLEPDVKAVVTVFFLYFFFQIEILRTLSSKENASPHKTVPRVCGAYGVQDV